MPYRIAGLMMVRRYIVKGRVQGVGFRWYVMREASALAMHGWVRNSSDGYVEVLASGTSEQQDALLAILQRGSRGSRVDAIEQQDSPETDAGTLKTFQIEGAW
ncbi:MAG TPA: acylphosphatase [Acidobacteriaceae bacterium]|jgi:acylphosphatase|nr:acylphosphatase [Acidobacteriaceae bacterium]